MQVHLVDGTFELCRAYFGAPYLKNSQGQEIGAARSLMRHLYRFAKSLKSPHIGVAFDHVIESFRNSLFEDYKTGEGMDEELMTQFGLAEDISRALGLVTWPMKKFEADDAIAAAAAKFSEDTRVKKILLCSPDKDLAQCVVGRRIVMWDRLRDKIYDDKGVREKFGIPPASIPDYLGLVGDTADGIPGIPKWGAKSTSVLLAKYKTIEKIPEDYEKWSVKVRGASSLSTTLNSSRKEAALYKKLATLRVDVPLKESLEDLSWKGVRMRKLKAVCEILEDDKFLNTVQSDIDSHN